ncbi:hypothetical protein FB45DRAFT_1036600 [Roridomyces roridus]|uniref:DUF6534 domain-containing protein n=1 Tax=Roridomyces roridus TaxID=1738132 RepID=A0AAD7FD33_9AGAR|nr:hypothetical protein FB45DRAFT_1036600 [Roridomyces roridus]
MATSTPSSVTELTTLKLLGMMINSGLTGSLIVQVFHYYCAFPNDWVIAKAAVYTVFILELLDTALMASSSYSLFGSGYGDVVGMPSLASSWTTWVPGTVLTALIASIVQTFYAVRLYSFSRSKFVAGIVIVLALLQCGSAMVEGAMINSTDDENRPSEPSRAPVPGLLWLGGSAICDLIIAGTMTFYLRRPTPISNGVKNKLSTLIRATIGTGTLTAVTAVLQLFVTFAFPGHQYYTVGAWTLGKFYSNSLLVLLNARAIVVGGRDDETNTQRAREIEVARTVCVTVSWSTLLVIQERTRHRI